MPLPLQQKTPSPDLEQAADIAPSLPSIAAPKTDSPTRVVESKIGSLSQVGVQLTAKDGKFAIERRSLGTEPNASELLLVPGSRVDGLKGSMSELQVTSEKLVTSPDGKLELHRLDVQGATNASQASYYVLTNKDSDYVSAFAKVKDEKFDPQKFFLGTERELGTINDLRKQTLLGNEKDRYKVSIKAEEGATVGLLKVTDTHNNTVASGLANPNLCKECRQIKASGSHADGRPYDFFEIGTTTVELHGTLGTDGKSRIEVVNYVDQIPR